MFVRNLLLAVGLVALLAGTAFVAIWLLQPAAKPVVQAASAQPHVSILVAVRPVAAGTLLRRDDMGWKDTIATDVSSAYLVRGQVSDLDYVGAVARKSFATDEPFTDGALVKSSERGFLAAVLAPGMRAVSIAVDAPQSAAGMILPGDRVDAILTQKFADTEPAARRTVGETILYDLRVVAIDQWMKPTPKPLGSVSVGTADEHLPKTITVEVSQTDAEKLMVAVELGNVGFSVRALQNGEVSPSEETLAPVWASDVSQALGTYVPVSSTAPVSSIAVEAPQIRTTVEVVRGSKTPAR
jgi:pilus assembly protein CpaB